MNYSQEFHPSQPPNFLFRVKQQQKCKDLNSLLGLYLYRSNCITKKQQKDPRESTKKEKQRNTQQIRSYVSPQGRAACSPCTLPAHPVCSKLRMIQSRSEPDPHLSVCLLHAKCPRGYGKPGVLCGQATLPSSFFPSNKKARMFFLHHFSFFYSQLQYVFQISKLNFKFQKEKKKSNPCSL